MAKKSDFGIFWLNCDTSYTVKLAEKKIFQKYTE